MMRLDSMLLALSDATRSLFDVTRPERRNDRRQLLWLLAIVVAGALLRFWDLGDIGLHREDEDTSALPVLGLLQTGSPVFPSGLLYYRAVLQTWLMAASVGLFGNSEWSLRLPSALCGVLLIVLGWQMGKRFLRPRWNLAFAAVLAFLPSLVLASQTARMYIFLIASLAGFSILVFRWERTGRFIDFFWSVVMMWIAVQFHTLALFAALLYFFPPLLHGGVRRLGIAALGVASSALAFKVIDEWTGQYFPQSTVQGFATRPPSGGPRAAALATQLPLTWLAAGALVAFAIAIFIARRVPGRWAACAAALLAFAALVAQLVPAWHVAALLLVATGVVALRFGQRVVPALITLGVASVALAVLQVLQLHGAGVPSLKNIGGVLLGRPSVWAYVRVADYSLLGAVSCLLLVAAAAGRLARRRPVPDVLLWLILGGWLPLLAVGFFVWNPPPRYTVIALLPMLLSTMVALQWLGTRLRQESVVALVIAVLLVVNPVAFARSYHAGYRLHPDHVRAAHYVLSQPPGPRDVFVAEDAISQRYYLPRVDYWLMARESIIDFVRVDDGEFRDIYTGSRIIGNGADLQALIDQRDRGAIYIIGSGENQEDGRLQMRGPELQARLTSSEFPVVYVGRDGLTKVWRIPPPRD